MIIMVGPDSRLRNPLDENYIDRILTTISELEEAVQRLQSLSLQASEVIDRLSQWGSISSY
jgi:Ni,Fe-hydrogenase III large subunit